VYIGDAVYTPDDWARLRDIRPVTSLAPETYRTPARRDAARLIHSPAFRRLQGKTQLFPGFESDYFRSRLTHSLEVGQIAKSIAIRLNNTIPELASHQLDVDLVEFAGWAHDLGHPPFGHQGEEALDRVMRAEHGGFEGNAQTLRILTRLEKRDTEDNCDDSGIRDGQDCRLGLNLTARSLAAILKYDRRIPLRAKTRERPDRVAKGYYASESNAVKWIKERIVGKKFSGKFKTIECQIMDLADDISYSTYDLEDTWKAGFFNALDMLSSEHLYHEVARKTSEAIGHEFTVEDVSDVLASLFSEIADKVPADRTVLAQATLVYATAKRLSQNGYFRARFTSRLIRQALEGLRFEFNAAQPVLSTVDLNPEARAVVEVLKHFTFEATIMSPRVKVSQFRANEIIETIFKALEEDDRLLPDDCRQLYDEIDQSLQKRVLCDFIAGMTDRYALEFYGRIKSENPQTIFKPL